MGKEKAQSDREFDMFTLRLITIRNMINLTRLSAFRLTAHVVIVKYQACLITVYATGRAANMFNAKLYFMLPGNVLEG